MKPGLERIRRFLNSHGNPQRRLNCVHIAGTNGKGSTARILAAILQGAGYKTGLYLSPHICDITERIWLNGRNIGSDELQAMFTRYRKQAKDCGLTFFEFMTGLAFIYFDRMGAELAVLETGLGGSFDATNVIHKPVVTVITDIDFDHRHLLGNTLAEIAGEKAGIIKKWRPLISGVKRPAAAAVIRRQANIKGAPLFELDRDFKAGNIRTLWMKKYQLVNYNGINESFSFRLPLLGEFQQRNGAMALAAAECVADNGFKINFENINKTLEAMRWEGRFDVRFVPVRGQRRTLVLDGAHNPGAMRAFVNTWKKSPWGKRKQTFIFGMLRDKDAYAAARELSPLAGSVIITPVASSRSMTTNDLRQLWERWLEPENITSARSAEEALRISRGHRITGVTGSLYLVGEIIRLLAGGKQK